ncbi:uncharacterized protein [Panulirus ornatus]|uniref:uncharacterized protein isoform X2 n=1 Tax=Panulirus ornatus TaxID=150431 RepID=UPI003A892AD6
MWPLLSLSLWCLLASSSSWSSPAGDPAPRRLTRLTFHDQIAQEFRAFIEEDDAEYDNKDNIILEEVEEEPTLWEAVLEGKTEVVEELLDGGLHRPDLVEKGRHTTPVMDAHLAGNKDVLRVFTQHKKEEPGLPTDDVIKSVLHELEKALKAVFVAAECGMYTHEQGVRALLEQHQLPGTVRDRRGRSLLHCMASISAMDGQPSWQPQHMKEFFANHEHHVNAVDHCGRTALHELSQHPRTADVQDIIWDGKEWILADAWLAVARFLTSYGCDPRIPDHKGRLPHQLAREAHNHELASFLEEKCRELGEVDVEQAAGQQEEVVRAAQQGDTAYLRELLDGGMPLLPAGGARTHPLLEAIRHSQRDAAMLLLCAGAPLCSPSSEGITPVRGSSHHTRAPCSLPSPHA